MGDNNFLQWRIDYSVGVQELDNQHKGIMLMINKLLEICREDDTPGKFESFNSLMLIIREQFQKHFEAEEKLMRETRYPKYEEHKKRHDKLLDDTQKMAERVKNDGQNVNLINLVIFIREWFVENIYGLDKQMGEYFNQMNQHTLS